MIESSASNRDRAYLICAELLSTLQRLLQRALSKRCGEGWFNAECPADVFRRLVQRKEIELQVDRCAGEYQELMVYTTFSDLAEIVMGIEGSASMFSKLASTEELFVATLNDLEAVRSRLCLGHGISDAELEVMEEIHAGFVGFLARTKKKGDGDFPSWDSRTIRPERGARTAVDEAPQAPQPEAEAATEDNAGAAPSPEPQQESAIDQPPQPPEPEVVPEVEPQPEPTPATEVPRPPAADDSEMLDSWELEEALEADDHDAVLDALRQEVTRIAEAIYGNSSCPRPRVWTTVHLGGWYDEHEAALGLGPLTHFYGMVHEYRKWQDEGLAAEAMVARLEEQGFPNLLLELRQLFMAGVK